MFSILNFPVWTFPSLAELTRGKTCIVSDIDRQNIPPRGTPKEVKEYVKHIFDLFAARECGLIFRGHITTDIPFENVERWVEEVLELEKTKAREAK